MNLAINYAHGYHISSMVRGYHVYEGVWAPTIGEELPEHGNTQDPYAVAVLDGVLLLR